MKKLKDVFYNLDKTDLKIMQIGLKLCLLFSLISVIILCIYLFFIHNLFLYNLGLTIFKSSTYIAIEFIICGVVADRIKQEIY